MLRTRSLKNSFARFPRLLLALLVLCGARAHALPPGTEPAQLSRRSWLTETGLPQNTVHSIVQDVRGYIWVATEEGLARFDGLGFTVFDRQNTPELRSNDVRSLLVGGKGGNLIWASTAGGLSVYDGVKWTTFTKEHGLAGNDVVAAYESRDGAVWAATNAGLSRWKEGRWTSFTTREGLADDNVQAVAEDLSDESGAMWVGTAEGLGRLAEGKFTNLTTADGLPGGVNVIERGPEGCLWLGTPAGLSCYKDGRFTNYTTREGLPNDRVVSLRADGAGGLWVGTAAGPALFREGRFESLAAPDPLAEAVVLSILEDREGSVWLGTESGGLHQLRSKKFQTYTTREGLTSDLVKAIYEDAAGDLWVGTYGAGLNLLRGGKVFKTFTTKDGLPSNVILALFSDSAGSLWVGTPDGLSRLRAGRFETYTSADGLPNDFVRSIYADGRGRLWVGTRGGLALLKGEEFVAYTTREGLTSDFVGTVYEDARGDIWVGTLGGLSKLEGERFRSYTARDGLPESAVIAIHGDAEGRVWVGTNGGGLGLLANGKIYSFTSRDGLPNDTVYRILEDARGGLWMSSKKGVFHIPKAELADFAERRAGSLNPILYGTADGMLTRECSGGGHPSGWRGRDGRLWFSTIKGVATIDPEKTEPNREPPLVVLEDVRTDGEITHDGTSQMQVSAGASRFDFHYVGLSFVAPEKVRYRYKLEGFDEDWVEGGDRRIAYYTNLGPGDYSFRVMACNNDGVWSDGRALYAFTLRPHFYRTYWFYALCLVALALLAWQLYALRVRQMRARFDAVLAERNRIAREIHDNLAQEILGISVQLELVARLWNASAESARTHLDRARGLVRSSIAEARRYVWDLRSHSLDDRDLPAALAEMTRRLAADSDVQTQFEVSGTFRPLPAQIENNLLRVGQEAVNNAVRHARARTVSVNLSFDATSVRLSVRDDGRGFDPAQQSGGRNGHFGIVGMRERAEEMGGRLHIESEPGRGSHVSVTVPIPV